MRVYIHTFVLDSFLFSLQVFTLAIWEGCSALCLCVWVLLGGSYGDQRGGGAAAPGPWGHPCRPLGGRCCGNSPGRRGGVVPRDLCTRHLAPGAARACLRGCEARRMAPLPCWRAAHAGAGRPEGGWWWWQQRRRRGPAWVGDPSGAAGTLPHSSTCEAPDKGEAKDSGKRGSTQFTP